MNESSPSERRTDNLDPVPPSSADLSPEEFRQVLDRVVSLYLRPTSVGVAILFLLLAGLHFYFLHGSMRAIMTAVACTSALLLLFLSLFLGEKRIPLDYGNAIISGIALLALFNATLHLILSRDPAQATNLVLIIILSGFFILSAAWYALILVVAWLGWGIALGMWLTVENHHFTIMMLQGTLLSIVSHGVLLRNHRENALNVKKLADATHYLHVRSMQLEKTALELQSQIIERIHANELLRQFVKNAPAPIAMVDRNMNYLLYSKRWLKDFHLGDRNLVGLNHYDVFPHIPAHWKESHNRCLAGAIEQCDEEAFLREDGMEEWIRWENQPWYEHGGNIGGIILFVEVITARKYAEEELRRSEERFRHYFNLSLIGNGIATVEGRFIAVNDYFCNILGYTHEELLHKTVFDLTHPDDLELSRERFREMVSGKVDGYSLVKRYIKKDGGIVHISGSIRCARGANGAPEYLVGNLIDITDRVLADQALRDSEERLLDFLNNANDLIQIVSPQGRFIFVNRVWKETLGYDDEEISRLTLWDTVLPERHSDCSIEFANVLQGNLLRNYETIFVAKDRRTIAVQGNINCRFEQGRPVAVRAIFRDVTDYNRAVNELHLAKEKAEEANRAKSQFLANMSHELRTPLNSVIGFANILSKNKFGNLTERELNFLDKIQSNGTHLLRLINDILDLAKVEAGRQEIHLTSVDLDPLIRETLSQLEVQLRGKSVNLEAQIPARLSRIDTDEGKLRQILINLIGNAIKFTDEGFVRVIVQTESATGIPIAIEVVDTGIGICLDRQGTIFEAFHQADSGTNRKYEGTGLGLAICRSFCQLLGYRLSLQSVEGQGSTFRIALK